MSKLHKLLLVILGIMILTYVNQQYSQYKYNKKVLATIDAVDDKEQPKRLFQ